MAYAQPVHCCYQDDLFQVDFTTWELQKSLFQYSAQTNHSFLFLTVFFSFYCSSTELATVVLFLCETYTNVSLYFSGGDDEEGELCHHTYFAFIHPHCLRTFWMLHWNVDLGSRNCWHGLDCASNISLSWKLMITLITECCSSPSSKIRPWEAN